MASRSRFVISALFGLVCLAAAGLAQSVARFVPAKAAADDRALELRFVREEIDATRSFAWPEKDVGWLFVRGEGTQQNLDALSPESTDATVLRIAREGAGVARVGWDLPARVEPTDARELVRFWSERFGPDRLQRAVPSLERPEPFRVVRLESLGLLVHPSKSESAAASSAVALSKTGQRMELRPLVDPLRVRPGGDFVFKLYLPEGGEENVAVRFVHLETRRALSAERLADGSIRAQLDRAGPWLLEAHRVRALAGAARTDGADLEIASTTLVFEVRAPTPREGGGR